jgi:ATP-dependent DNA helicase DinG
VQTIRSISQTPDFDTILGADGPLSGVLHGFKARPAQQQMAARIHTALRARELLLVEAGTGTGKTYAYLIPALLSGLRILISTGTRTLQDQLFHRDLPLLSAALGRPARVTLLKGRSNYLCRARFADIGRQEELLTASTDPLLSRLREWSLATRSGDLAEVPELADAHPLRPYISSTRENCVGLRCSEFSRCHVVEARREAMEADIVVVNHHLLLADLALKEDGFGDLLPSVDAVILDEAHQLPDLASEFFGIGVSSRQLEILVAEIKRAVSLKGAPQPVAATLTAELERVLSKAHGLLGRAERSLGWEELRDETRSQIGALRPALSNLAAQLDANGVSADLQQCATRAHGFAAALGQIVEDPDDVSEADGPVAGARTVSTHLRGFTLRLLPYEIADRFRGLVRQAHSAWIFTSATLAVGEDFSHFAGRLGLDDAATLRFDSPFDYASQALLYLPPEMPEPSEPQFGDAVIEIARPLIQRARGGAFLLFTSHRALRAAAERLGAQLPPEQPLLVQGTAPREQLLRQFRASGRAVLLGTASFWEGVDVQGPALRLVIIDKLPFASPEDPVVRARIEFLNSQGMNAFWAYQLPEAVLALKQGVGRLIRSEADHGVVVICDPRMTRRAYGRIFRSSLPPMSVTRSQGPVLERLAALARACDTEFAVTGS